MKRLLILIAPLLLAVASHGQDAAKTAIEKQINDSIRTNGVRQITAQTLNVVMHSINRLNMDSSQVMAAIQAQISLTIPGLTGGIVPLSQLPRYLDTMYLSSDTLYFSIKQSNSAGHTLYYIVLPSSGGGGTYDSTSANALQTKYRSDTSRVNVYTAIASVNTHDTTSANALQSKYRSDTSRANTYAAIAGINTHDSTSGNALQTKYRSDTARANVWNAITARIVNAGGATSIKVGTYASRPAAATCNCFYVASDSAKWYYDNGAWLTIGGGAGGLGVDSGTGVIYFLKRTNSSTGPTVYLEIDTAHLHNYFTEFSDITGTWYNDTTDPNGNRIGVTDVAANLVLRQLVDTSTDNTIINDSTLSNAHTRISNHKVNQAGTYVWTGPHTFNANVHLPNIIAPASFGVSVPTADSIYASVNGLKGLIVLPSRQIQFPTYIGPTAIPVTAAAMLVTDAAGNVGTQALPTATPLASSGTGNTGAIKVAVDGTDSVKTIIAGTGIVVDSTSVPRSIKISASSQSLPSFYFNPGQDQQCAAWYDASNFQSVTLSALGTQTRMTALADLSGHGNNLLQSDTTKSPTYNFAGGANNLPYATVSNASMLASGVTIPQPYVVYIVVNHTTFVQMGDLFQFGSATTNGISDYGPDTRGRYSVCAVASTAWQVTDAMNAHTGWQLYKITFQGTFSNVELNEQLKLLFYYKNQINPGSASLTQIQMGENSGGPHFGFEEMVIMAGTVNDVKDRQIRDYFFTKYGLTNNDYIAWFGDSIFSGSALSNSDSCFAYVVTDTLGKDYYNYGIAGTEVWLGTTPFLYTKNYLRGGNTGWAIVGYGTNDFCSVTASVWKTNLEAIIQQLINYGYSRSKIILVSPPYQPVKTCLAGTVTQLTTIASDLGVTFVDVWGYTQTYPGGCPLLVDNIHPNGTCNRIIALYLLGFIH